jgi:hypothetical protein
MNNDHVWTQSSTDITLRWRKLYGYVPASEQARFQLHWKEWRARLNRTLEDLETPEQDEKNTPISLRNWKRK